MTRQTLETSPVKIKAGGALLNGDLTRPEGAMGLVIFAHGSGSSRLSPRNQAVARYLNDAGLGTLLMDLLTSSEQELDDQTRQLRFDIELLAMRLVETIDWASSENWPGGVKIGLFGASTGAAGALVAAARRPEAVSAIVSRGGRPDLAGQSLKHVRAPVLLIVGGLDDLVIDLNHEAADMLLAPHEIKIVRGATHLFEEPGKLQEVSELACEWFQKYLG